MARAIDSYVQKMVAGSEIVGMGIDVVIFADGRVARAGDRVRIGLEDRQIVRVDFSKRAIRF